MTGGIAERIVERKVAILGRLGVYPMVRLSLPARRLLAYLALQGRPVSRTAAAGNLWLDLPEDAGRANLRRALWHVPRGWIEAVGDELALSADVDFARAQAVAAHALRGEALTYEDIVLLSNDVLPGWHEEWLIAGQEAFRLLRVEALEAACRMMTTSGDLALAAQAGMAALAAEPLRESAAEALIDAYLAQRNRYQAVQCYRSLAKRLACELGVAPDEALAKRVASICPASRTAH
ncbi:AfsR/SARP family transcriptional regulator [Bradyrhizobium sp. CCBAU 53415]|uniref:AfsR/SARP family transcriptional regulator n=1 Tax=Bradyrhizobium sp. CCBAU 53415 TaxID=1325119 RepID=UPI0023067664|nr:BTAD domain-containing putative transcriptional regulator [Bradyrhizobium sp. CCBAU 53415]